MKIFSRENQVWVYKHKFEWLFYHLTAHELQNFGGKGLQNAPNTNVSWYGCEISNTVASSKEKDNKKNVSLFIFLLAFIKNDHPSCTDCYI